MKICIAGDSWGFGEFDVINNEYINTHKGLAHFLSNRDHTVKNFCFGGASNLDIFDQINDNINDFQNADLCLVIVTDTSRQILSRYFWCTPCEKEFYLQRNSQLLFNYFNKLNKLGISLNLIGGLSHLSNSMIDGLNNLSISIDSIQKLLIPDATHYDLLFLDNLKNIPKNINRNVLEYVWYQQSLWENITKQNIMNPDGHHPNREGHQIIFNHLKDLHNL